MATKEQRQQRVGTPAKRRGQQIGFAGQPDRSRAGAAETPALRGRLKRGNKMFAEDSSQQISSSGVMAFSSFITVQAAQKRTGFSHDLIQPALGLPRASELFAPNLKLNTLRNSTCHLANLSLKN